MINPTVSRMNNGGWLFTWDPGTPPYSIWLDGLQLEDDLTDEEFEFNRPGYDSAPPDLEILNDGDASESEASPPFAFLQWRGITSISGYVVEQFIGAVWTRVQTITEQGRGYYSWRSRPLPDGVSTQFRVKALSLTGNAGAAIPFTMETVRNPAAPLVSLAVVAGDLVVSAG